jgi:Mn-containing catalase
MFMRIDRLLTELPPPTSADPDAASALQELLGGKYGEMSTLNTYMFQSFNFRGRSKLRPIYDVVASITAEEVGHVELVTHGVAMLNTGPEGDEIGGADVTGAPYAEMTDIRLAASFIGAGGGGRLADSEGLPWNGGFVTSTGNLILDMLFNFHLECGARLHKLRVYETLSDATGREVCGYLLVRGSVHAHAYGLILKKLTGVDIEKMLPVPNINLSRIPECRKYLAEGEHRRLYTNSPDDYRAMSAIWGQGEMALPGDPPGELEVVEGAPTGAAMPDMQGMASAFSPEYSPEEMFEIATRLYRASR